MSDRIRGPERYESDNSLILNLGLHVVTRSMLSPILCDYDRINSVVSLHRVISYFLWGMEIGFLHRRGAIKFEKLNFVDFRAKLSS